MTAPAKELFVGTPFGKVYPPRQAPHLPALGPRDAALRVLSKYISELTFFRFAGHGRAPTPFRIPESRFFAEWPDPEVTVEYPSIQVMPAKGDYEIPGLTTYPFEPSKDQFGKGTVLVIQTERTEMIQLRCTASSRAERSAMVAGLEVAMAPIEQYYGLRFIMPDYFGEVVCFTLMASTYEDDDQAGRNRRHALVEIQMRHNVVALVNYVELLPEFQLRMSGAVEDTGGVERP